MARKVYCQAVEVRLAVEASFRISCLYGTSPLCACSGIELVELEEIAPSISIYCIDIT